MDIQVHQIIDVLLNTLNIYDSGTFNHSMRVAEIAVLIGREMQLESEELEYLHLASHLHDIGKIGVPQKILQKPGELIQEEIRKIQEHPVIGFELLLKTELPKAIMEGILHHHERYDGFGYPHCLKGETIPLIARIISVADSFDALTSHRSYRRKVGFKEALAEIHQHTKEQFCPEVILYLNKIWKEIDRNLWEEEESPLIYKEVQHNRAPHSTNYLYISK